MSDKNDSEPWSLLGIAPLNFLLVAVPTAAVLHWRHADPLWVFLAACIAIIPLAGLMGRATENLAETMGPSLGGLLNATFGNAAELIIAMLALYAGKTEIVKASITGSIIGNVLLVLGLSILLGGLRFRQAFNRTAAGLGTTLMALSTVGLLVPTIYFYLVQAPPPDLVLGEARDHQLEYLSEEIAGILAFTYILSLLFTLKTHQHLFAPPEAEGGPTEKHEPEWGRGKALTILVVATIGVAFMSEFLVHAIEPAAAALGMNEIFVGVIVVAVIGNAAEHSTAVLVAMKDKMDLAVTIAVGSSIQIGMFVAPVLVLASVLMGQPMDLHFSPLEVVAVIICVGIMALVAQDGESHWMEGVMMLAVYVILGLAFYHLPKT